jgi:flagellar biosynthesis/type III secretory pathway chaperone
MQALDVDRLVASREACARLKRILDEEFSALRDQSLERFEQIHVPKAQILSYVAETLAAHRKLIEQGTELPVMWLSAWEAFRAAMLECRDLHRRNELLILRKRDAIQGALSALVGQNASGPPVDLYDRLGKIRRTPRGNAYTQA